VSRWQGANAAELGKAIKSRHRVGDCRILVKVKDSELTILASDVAQRSGV
jgi:mRNA-degrading endonuclease RelE of RelBE toxin-antitoxin system